MEYIRERLLACQDKEYGDFHAKLVPNLPRENIIGVRVPVLRKLAKELRRMPEGEVFLEELPHQTYDENMLHGLMLTQEKDYQECLQKVKRFLPYIDNWAVCDCLSPKVFQRHREELMEEIPAWASSGEVYTCRFGLEMLMKHFLEEDFREAYLEIPAGVRSEEYYVNMMIAWFYATALSKQWESAIPYLENRTLTEWVHNKTIQKAIESYRITPQQKAYLRTLKR